MKSFLQNLKMSRKIMTAPLVLMIFMIVIATISYRGMSNQKNALDDIFTIRFQTFQDASQLITQITTVNKNVYRLLGLANSGMDAAKIDANGKELIKEMGDVTALIKNTATKPLDPQEKTLFDGVMKEVGTYEAMLLQVVQMTAADATMAITMMTPIENRFQAVNGKLKELITYEQQLSRRQHESAGNTFNLVVRSFFVTLAVALVLSLFVSLTMAKLILRPLRKAVEAIQEIAEGDLTREIQLDSKDEIGDLARAVDTMRLKMGDAVGQSASTAQILSDSASKQAASLEETSSSLEEMASMIRQSAENAAQTNQHMSASQEVIKMADSSAVKLNDSMKEIAAASEQTQKIVKTIDEIAFQTNLLALNAAVEAARAGEAGAGFAVVADEVRNLALRAAEAARNSSGMMEDIVAKVKNGEKLVTVTYNAFRQVTDSSEKVVNLMGNIVTATREQSQGIDQINRAVLEMNQVTQENAASSEELAAVMAMFRTNEGGSDGRKRGTPRKMLPEPRTGNPGKGTSAGEAPKRPQPKQVIPFEEGEFKDF